MAVDMNLIIPYYPLPPKPPKPFPTKPSIREHYLPQPAPMPSAQSIIPEPPFTHPPPWSPLPCCRDTLSGLDSPIGVRASNAPLNEFDAELERLDVVEVVDMSSRNYSTDRDDVEPSSARVAGMIQGSTAPDTRPRREASSDRPSQKADRSSPRKITPPLSDHDPALDECEPKALCPPSGLAGFTIQHPHSFTKLPRSEGRQAEQPIVVDLESDGENPPNNDESRRTIGLDVRTGATGRGIMGTSSTPGAKSVPGTPASPGKCAGEERRPMGRRRLRRTDVRVEIPSPPDALREREGRGDRSDPSDLSDNSDFNNSSDCSSSGDDDEAYRESDDDDHVTRRPRKRRKLWTRRSSRSVVTSAACTGDPSPTAVVNDKPGKRNPTTKHDKNPASDSSNVSAVPLDDAVTNRSGDDIPVSGFLSSYVAGSRVCYTITFCHEETGRLLSANANGLSSLGREERPSVATGIRVPFTSEDDALLKELKEGGEPWDEITERFPGRSKATLQVRYSTKLKHRTPPPTRKSKSKSRPRKHGCR